MSHTRGFLLAYAPTMRSGAARRLVSIVAALVAVCGFAAPTQAQEPLELGRSAADDRVEVTVVKAQRALEYANLPGSWFVADVRLVGIGGLDTTAILDWRLKLSDGSEVVPFPGEAANVAGGRVEPGVDVTIRLGFMIGEVGGAAQIVFQPFLDQAPLASWAVTIEAVAASDPATPSAPLTTIPPVSIDIELPQLTSGYEHVRSFDARYEIRSDTSIVVTETVEYDFGPFDRHGIFRDLALFQPIDDDRERTYPISEVTVTADPGTPSQYDIFRTGDLQRIRIGDPDRTINGIHTYTIRYRLDGALNPQSSGPELFFNVTGVWDVGMDVVTIEVVAPGGVDRVACYAGPAGSTQTCTSAAVEDGVARFAENGLLLGEQVTIVAALPSGSVDEPVPILGDAPRDVEDAIEPGLLNIGGAAAVLGLGLVGVGSLVWRKGRDLESTGSHVDARFAPDDDAPRRLPVLRRVETPVEFAPPDHIRPGLLGTLYDERADPVDVSASIVDLAVRGFLRIEEVPKQGWFGKSDHRLVKLRDDDGSLLAYERMLLTGLFSSGDTDVLLSDLKDSFASTLAKIQSSMYAEVVRHKWFDRRPDKTRAKWLALGFVVLLGGVGALVLAFITRYAVWPAAALVVIGLVVLVTSRWMPRRTARGTAALRHVEGFRRFIVDSESRRSEFDERQNLFTEYLPYAIVFGCVDKWARTFADLQTGELPATGAWYVGTHRFDARSFSSSVNGFASTAGSTMSSTPGGSGGSGFSGGSSGGGGGGGGGGSW